MTSTREKKNTSCYKQDPRSVTGLQHGTEIVLSPSTVLMIPLLTFNETKKRKQVFSMVLSWFRDFLSRGKAPRERTAKGVPIGTSLQGHCHFFSDHAVVNQ